MFKSYSTKSVSWGSAALLCAATLSAGPAGAQQCNVSIPGVPDFDQKRASSGSTMGLPGDGDMYCVPTSTTDWLAYIANHGMPEVLDGPRNWQSQDNYDFVTDRIAYVGELMSTDAEDGTTWGAIPGTIGYLQEKAPGAFTVTGQVAVAGFYPTPEGIYDAMANGGLVNITLGKYERNEFDAWNRVGGHIVALHRIESGCSAIPGLWWRDPSTSDSESKTAQSSFASTHSEMDEVSDLWALPNGWGAPATMWRFLKYEEDSKQRFLDSFTVITPMVTLTTDDQWDSVEVDSADVMDDDQDDPEDTPDVVEDAPDGNPFYWLDFHPLRHWSSFYATTAGDDGSGALYEYDAKAAHLEEIQKLRKLMELRRPTPIVTGRHAHLYLVDDGVLLQLDIAQRSEKPVILNAADLKGAMPDAMVYDDTADEVTLLFARERRLVSFSMDLATRRDRALPRGVELRGEALMANNSQEPTLWLGSSASNLFFELAPSRDGGDWQLVQAARIDGAKNPSSLQVAESGNLVVVIDGVVAEFSYDARAKRWVDARQSYIAGMRAGRRFVLARSRNNFDADMMSGPGWTHYLPEARDLTGEVPDCPADLTGSDKPDAPGWEAPDGVVDAMDWAYFQRQYEQGNRRVADLTASNHPDDPLYSVPDGYLDQEDLDYYSDLFAKTKGYCRR